MRTHFKLLPYLFILAPGASLGIGALSACNATGAESQNDGGPWDGASDAGLDAGFPDKDAGPSSDAGMGDAGSGGPLGETIQTESGALQGKQEADLIVFKGIPYAAPPVGTLRFKVPQPVDAWSGVRDAKIFAPACAQRDYTGALVGSEDCLALNIWAPAVGGARPVMVFIHGGAFVQGATNLPTYDGAQLARNGELVVVSLQYRLGALGFLATDQLVSEGRGAGNYGILDQQAALAWVQRNIAAFGGDPARVTLFGESAGGISVCVHLGAPSSDTLFSRAIIESGTGCYGLRFLNRSSPLHSSAIEQGNSVISAAGCGLAPDKLACLRALPAYALVDAGWRGPSNGLGLPDFSPTIDGDLLSEEPFDRVLRGDRKVPLISGTNADEAMSFTTSLPIPTAAAYEAQLRSAIPVQQADAVLALYPATDFSSPKAAYNALLSDLAFVCPALSFVEQAGSAGLEARAYHFTHLLGGTASNWGAFHGLELWFVFGTLDTLPGYLPTSKDRSLSQSMQTAWTDFAWGRAPLAALPWEPATSVAPAIVLLDQPVSLAREIRQGRCAGLIDLGLVR